MHEQIERVMAGKRFRRECKFTGDDLKENYFNLKKYTLGIRISYESQRLSVFVTDGVFALKREFVRDDSPYSLVTILKDVKATMKEFHTIENAEENASFYRYKKEQNTEGFLDKPNEFAFIQRLG